MSETLTTLVAEGGATLVLIAFMSVVALAVSLERVFLTRSYGRRMAAAAARILEHLRQSNAHMAQAVNETVAFHPGAELFKMILAGGISGNRIRRLQGQIIRGAKTRLWMVGTIGATAPFVGLFGTVLGVMKAFQQIGAQGGGGFAVVSAGISEALITTAGGILVGVEAMVLFNFLQVRIGDYAAALRDATEEIVEARAELDHGHPNAVG